MEVWLLKNVEGGCNRSVVLSMWRVCESSRS